MIRPPMDRMIRPRGVLVVPHGTSMVARLHEDHAREVLRVRRMQEEAREADENAAKRLKARLVEQLVAIGRERVETERFKVAVQRAPSSVEVLVDPALLPPQFRREIPATIEADKTALRAALKLADEPNTADLTVDGLTLARLLPGTPYLRVR